MAFLRSRQQAHKQNLYFAAAFGGIGDSLYEIVISLIGNIITVPFVVNVINLFHLAFNNKQYHKSLYISIPKCNKRAIEKAAIILCRFCSITLNIFLQMTVFQVRVFLCIRIPQLHLKTSLHR